MVNGLSVWAREGPDRQALGEFDRQRDGFAQRVPNR